MIGLDTSVLVRYPMRDDPRQSAYAADLIDILTPSGSGVVSIVALTETAWVLDLSYGLNATEIAAAAKRTLRVAMLRVEREQDVFTAMIEFARGSRIVCRRVDSKTGRRAGCAKTFAFDRKALRIPGFEDLSLRRIRCVRLDSRQLPIK
ncbi:MAG TPA: hypothetical protein VMU81_27695 [Acetobacteraceae bacterium]|nr:hypothetical protein [Acetobacteraceae bacterium]